MRYSTGRLNFFHELFPQIYPICFTCYHASQTITCVYRGIDELVLAFVILVLGLVANLYRRRYDRRSCRFVGRVIPPCIQVRCIGIRWYPPGCSWLSRCLWLHRRMHDIRCWHRQAWKRRGCCLNRC